MIRHIAAALIACLPALGHAADAITLKPTTVTEWKAVYGLTEAKNRVPARARIGGSLASLSVTEGDTVEAGQVIARIVDVKLDFQLSAMDSQLEALEAQLENARSELKRGEELLARGVTTTQRLDALRTQVDVLEGQIEATRAERHVVEQQSKEGDVLAPQGGRVLEVPVTKGAVLLPGELVAQIGGGGFFLRLSVPERHAPLLKEGDGIVIDATGTNTEGQIAKIYPSIQAGRVVVDVEVADISDVFVNARVLVRLPVGKRETLLVPDDMVVTRSGLDFVATVVGETQVLRSVVLGRHYEIDGVAMTEVLTGLAAGDKVTVASDE
ncbi:MAG: efflux RND transporter periplasmic adaptor subunit [Brevirhabdus sp.]